MDLVINNHIIKASIEDILKKLQSQTGMPKQIIKRGDNYSVTCPFHKDGNENHPSCQVYCGNSADVEYGYVHCFTCGENCSLYHLIAKCLGKSDEVGKQWLINNFGDTFIKTSFIIDVIASLAKNRLINPGPAISIFSI